jgi:hypothetical protein
MLRRALLAAVVALAACAHTPINDANAPVVQETARVLLASISRHEETLAFADAVGDQWPAFEARMAPMAEQLHWRCGEPIPPGAEDAARCRGWMQMDGARINIAAVGNSDRVLRLEFEHNDEFTALSFLNALRAQGAEVDFQSDYETYSEYVVQAPGRTVALLTTVAHCSPFEREPGERCAQTLILTYDVPW